MNFAGLSRTALGLARSFGGECRCVICRYAKQIGFLRSIFHRARLDESLAVDHKAKDNAIGRCASGVFFIVLGPRPIGARQPGDGRIRTTRKHSALLRLRRPARNMLEFPERARSRGKKCDGVRVALENRGRAAGGVDSLQALCRQPSARARAPSVAVAG